jgi:hypothetical protein
MKNMRDILNEVAPNAVTPGALIKATRINLVLPKKSFAK